MEVGSKGIHDARRGTYRRDVWTLQGMLATHITRDSLVLQYVGSIHFEICFAIFLRIRNVNISLLEDNFILLLLRKKTPDLLTSQDSRAPVCVNRFFFSD